MRSPELSTPWGSRAGDLESKVLDLLDSDRFTRIRREHANGHTRKSTGSPSAEQHLGVAFTVEDGVERIAGGLDDDVHRLDGCA
ncbi:MAG: hypothetical protein OEW42_17685 [Acidimicrobiia bacterium]|nr:hypothetical protein [Acidimicrobiia bacterium]